MTEFNNIKLIKRGDIAYPTQLEEVYQPPETLYCLGNVNLLYKRMVAVVGSRKCSEYGKKMAMKLGEVLSRADISVVSGMAKGIDSFGHIGALKQEGGTVAVLGCGVDVCYPAENKKLYEQIMRKGLIISEYPPGTKPTPYQFPQRNRIIAGLVKAIVIVEASSASGSLITAELGENLGKDIYALPGNITSPWSLGTNKLIADGAIPLVVIEDIIRDLGGSISPAADEVEQLSKAEREILITLKQEGEVSMEELCHILQKSPTEIGGIVAVLEIKGFVAYHFGKIFLAK